MSITALPEIPLNGDFSSLPDVMDAIAAQFGDHEAYVDKTGRVTFGEWVRRADGLAATLVSRGIRPGDVVAVMMDSSIDYTVCVAAAIRAGAIATGLSTRIGAAEFAEVFACSQPRMVIRDRALGLPEPPCELVLERDDLEELWAGPGLGTDRPHLRPSDPAVIIWTSGTTGAPKGAVFDHANLRAAVASAGVMSAPFDRRLMNTPLQHAGYMAKLWDQLASVQTSIIGASPWHVDTMLRALIDERITVAGGVPTQWIKLLGHPELPPADQLHLRVGIAAMAPVPPELVAAVQERLGVPLIVRYAMTESPSVTGTAPGDDPEVLLRTVGRPRGGMEVKVVDANGAVVPSGRVGRVCVKGPCVMRGYVNRPELTAQVLNADGWLQSSDLGFFDDAGNLVLRGRSDDLYIRGGYNIYPLEVEHVLLDHPAVDKAAVVGRPTPVIGETGVAFVVPADPAAPPSLEELRAWVSTRLADYKAPDHLELVDALPMTPMMKVDKRALRAMHDAASQTHRPT